MNVTPTQNVDRYGHGFHQISGGVLDIRVVAEERKCNMMNGKRLVANFIFKSEKLMNHFKLRLTSFLSYMLEPERIHAPHSAETVRYSPEEWNKKIEGTVSVCLLLVGIHVKFEHYGN